ncbi:MAG TPA: hypothetical protein VG892_08690 [Terriglobales bacterium]|nr:hypothetical protein [Terriglobales bacterium]
MKLGADNPKKTIATAVLMAVALLLFFRTFIGGSSGSPKPAAANAAIVPSLPVAASTAHPVPPRPRRTARRSQKQEQPQEVSFTASLDPRLRLDLLAVAEQTTYSGSGRNIFRAEAEPVVIPKPVAPAMRPPEASAVPSGPPPTPPPPPINLKFFGFATGTGQPKRVFLSKGDDIFVAAEGEIVDRRYKIIHIGDRAVEVEDMLSNRRQSLPLTT